MMQNVTAILSMLHEPEAPNSATRHFRAEPVLSWTLARLCRARRVGNVAVLCWEDQLPHVEPIAEEHHAYVLAKGPRQTLPHVEAVAAAQRWANGWRGGLLSTCDFDRGFHAPWIKELSQRLESDAVVLIDPASALVDPALIDRVIEHADRAPHLELCFAQTAPGLCGPLLRPALLDRLCTAGSHPGRLLHYMPDHPVRDPIAGDACVAVPTAVSRSPHSFKLDSQRQLARIGRASKSLNGALAATDAEALVARVARSFDDTVDEWPREIVVELNTSRQSRSIFWPGTHLSIARGEPLPVGAWSKLFAEAGAADDVRLTIGGVGDPLECDQLFSVIDAARSAGIRAIHVQTDSLASPERVDRLAASDVDVISVNLPAMSVETYAAVMGVDRFKDVLTNIARLVRMRQARSRGVPIVVPVFAKLKSNLAEMEIWYDQWLRTLGCAVIESPSDFGGQIPGLCVADMSPPVRKPCVRLNARLVVLCDGTVVACEQDVTGAHPVGRIGVQTLREIWANQLKPIRADHACGRWKNRPLCVGCREWHRAA
jgi:MoaA/NifB/PqqE/SkfB family radical SAM enzyme